MEDELIAFLTANLLAPFLQGFAKNAADQVTKRRDTGPKSNLTTPIRVPPYATDLVFSTCDICFVQSRNGIGKILSSSDLLNWIEVYRIPESAKLAAYIYQSKSGEWILCDGGSMRVLV